MNKSFITILLIICSITLFAQDKITDEIRALYENGQYDKIIQQYTEKTAEYSAAALYYIGASYYEKEDDKQCIKYMDLSINKDARMPQSVFVKACALYNLGSYQEAANNCQLAISLNPNNATYYFGLGDCYRKLGKNSLAIDKYKIATQFSNCPEKVYIVLAETYTDMNDQAKALEAYYVAKTKFAKASQNYLDILYNIGFIETLLGDYSKAETAYIELVQSDPKDYEALSKLIQVYYHNKEYIKAKPYKQKLYEAYKNGFVPESNNEMFCFDQFQWNGYKVQVFERFESETQNKAYVKHIFFVINNADNVVFKVQTEYSPVSVQSGGPKYVLVAKKGTERFMTDVRFNDDFNYDVLKAEAIKLMEKYMK